MSAWPALDPAATRAAAWEACDDVWRGERLRLVSRVLADRALLPSARHGLVELLLDPVVDARFPIDDDHLPWGRKLARRLGLSPRGARKALDALEAAGAVKHDRGGLEFLRDGWAERTRLGTDAPRLAPEGLDPLEAHALRLERLCAFALGEGLFATALSTQRTIEHVLGFDEPQPEVAEEATEATAVEEPAPTPEPPPLETPQASAPPAQGNKSAAIDVMPIIRRMIGAAPDMAQIMLETLAEIRTEEAAKAVGPPSPFETPAAQPPQGEGYLEETNRPPPPTDLTRPPHPEEATEGGRLEG